METDKKVETAPKGEFPNKATQIKSGEVRNPKCQKYKSFAGSIRHYASQGYDERLSYEMLKEGFERLLCKHDEELQEITDDPEQPNMLKVMVKGMLSNRAFDYIKFMVYRTYGRPLPYTKENEIVYLLPPPQVNLKLLSK